MPFFLPGFDSDAQEQELLRLRATTKRSTGSNPTQRRIQRLVCRIDGKDCEIEVGLPGPGDGAQVLAIFEHRHLPYSVCVAGHRDCDPLLVKQVYAVTEFA